MNSRLLKIGGRLYEFKIGLKGLIELRKIINIKADEHFDIILHWGLWPQEVPHMTAAEREEIIEEIKSVLAILIFPSNDEVDEWYIRGIGEIGMPLSTFYCLTPYELDLAYQGYLRKMELAGNLNQLGVMRANNRNDEPISLVKDREVSQGSISERLATFANLGIQEVL